MKVYINNGHLLVVDELVVESADGTTAYANTATVTAQIKDNEAANVGTAITCTYVTASNGRYVGNIEEDVAWDLNESFSITIDADAGSDRKAQWTLPIEVLVRTN